MGIFDSLKAVYDSIEEAYYGFAEGLQTAGVPFMDFFVTPIEARGIPSLPVFILLFVALVGGALVLLTSQADGGTRSLSITVQSAGQAVDGADVQILFQDSIIAQGKTKAGKITFDGLPGSALTVRVSKSGFKTLTLKASAGQSTLKADLKSTPPGTEDLPDPGSVDYNVLTVVVLDAGSEQPVTAAQVLYVSEDGSGTKATDEQGRAVLPKAALTNIRVSKEGYKTETLAVRDGGQTTVFLKSLSGSFFGGGDVGSGGSGDGSGSGGNGAGGGDGNSTQLATFGAVTIQLSSSAGPLEGHVRLYGAGGTLLGESDTVAGAAAFSAEMGSSVFVTAQVANFPLYDGSSRPQTVTEDTQILITLDASGGSGGGNALDTVIRAQDVQGNPLPFSARIIKAPLIELATYEGERWELQVQPGAYYVYLDSDGYLSKTADLQAGKDNVFTLEKATAFNSAALTVAVQDEYGAALSGARVTLFQNGRLASPAQSTDFSGSAVFSELSLSAYDVLAEHAGQNATARVSIEQGGSRLRLQLTIHRAALRVSAVSALDNAALASVSVHVDSQGQAFADATTDTNGSSRFSDVPAQVQTHVILTKAEHVPFVADLVLLDGENRVLPAVLIPQSATQGAQVGLVQIRDLSGQRVSQLKTGQQYVVELNATPAASATNQSIYLRVGSKADMESDDAYIAEYTGADAVLRSSTYNPSANCQDLASHLVSNSDGYKWVELRFNQPAVRIATFLLQIKPDARSNQPLSLYFATQTNSGLLSARDPPDAQAALCYPRTYEYKIPLVRGISGTLQGTPTPTPGPATPTVLPTAGTFTTSVNIHYNPATGKVEADATEITLQVDPIYPRDSVPLRITDEPSCAIETRIEATHSGCYQLGRTSLAFEAKDYRPDCPASVKANEVILPQGDANLILAAICAPNSQIKLPIRINAQSATSINTAPATLDEGEKTAKLLYVINQKQAGTRTLTPLGASGSIAVAAQGAAAFSWSGPGTLTLLDGDAQVGQWTYNNAPAYFDGIGTMGPRVETASDYLSCAQGWCSGQAALQALRHFQTAAKNTAVATMFRRGQDTALPSAQPTPVPTAIPSITPTPSASASPSATASVTPTPSATARATAFITPTPTPSATSTPTPTPSASADSTPVTLHVNDVKTAANGNQIKLTEILQASGTTYAGFDIRSPAGTVLTAISKQQGEFYEGNGLRFQVTAITWSDSESQRSVQVQLLGSWTALPAASADSDGVAASFENRPDSVAPSFGSSLSFATTPPITREPFVFSTVMQLTEGADKAFDILGVQRVGAGCGGLPGVYHVTASSLDGNTFTYSAQAMKLEQSFDGRGQGLLLCGFLHAAGNQVVTGKNPALPSQNQASEEHTKPDTKLAIFTLAPVYKQQCEALGNQVVTLQKKIAAEKADLKQAGTALQAAVTQLQSGVNVAIAAEAASKGAKSSSVTNSKVPAYTCTEGVCVPCAKMGCAPGYDGAIAPNGQAVTADGAARLNLFNAKTALSEAIAQTNLPEETSTTALPSPAASSPGPATAAAQKLEAEFTIDIGAVETSRQSALKALQAANPPATDAGSAAAVAAAAESSGLASAAQTKTAAALALAKTAAQAVTQTRLAYDKDVQQLAATKQKCNAMRPPLFEIPFGLWPQQSQFACPTSDRYEAEAAKLEAEKLATQKALDVASEYGADFGADLDKQIADAKALAAKGCVALCKPKPACVESFPSGRQFTQVIHLGLSSDCQPFSKTAAQDLAKSMVANTVMKSLGPYAMMASFATGGSCNGAQGYFSKDNLGGPGSLSGGPSGGYIG
ncbi:carboxypeptidase regulatory-like domain-containing protein [Candidatus Micrarchaeota archaeon]|nr:carboxypeptidase regulatory-like domain-containing protein [Candidatus Micrarchaeota archaeon]